MIDNSILEFIVNRFCDGCSMMFVGMSTVLVFLCIMIFAMNVMSKVVEYINTIWPEPVAEVAGSKSKKKASSNDEEIAVAVLAAVLKK